VDRVDKTPAGRRGATGFAPALAVPNLTRIDDRRHDELLTARCGQRTAGAKG